MRTAPMLSHLSSSIKEMLRTWNTDDSLILNNTVFPIIKNNFHALLPSPEHSRIAFIDGGQAEIISAGNFCLSFIRIAAVVFNGNTKITKVKNEFYLLTTATWKEEDILYESRIFPLTEKLIDERDLSISSTDGSITSGRERAQVNTIASMARRFSELALAATVPADFILIDGTLEATFKNEKKYIGQLPHHTGALAKTSSLFTISGNSPTVLLHKLSPVGCWYYAVDHNNGFVKLHPQAKHVFRVQGNREVLPYLLDNSGDALFLGYPYGLISVDALARVSIAEQNSLKMNFLLREENKEIVNYLNATNAHNILDRIG